MSRKRPAVPAPDEDPQAKTAQADTAHVNAPQATTAQMSIGRARPTPARSVHRPARRSFDALSGLTVFAALQCLIPSNLVITPMGSLGRPALLWGLLLALWWAADRLQAPRQAMPARWQPIRLAFGAFLVVALISYAAALLRGQPADQISPATTAIVRLVSWAGVLLAAMDGIHTMAQLRMLLDRVVSIVALVAALGLVQTVTGQEWLDRIVLPGFSLSEDGGVQLRGALTRAVGTATHPLEYAMLLGMALPVAIALAALRPADTGGRGRVSAWLRAGLVAGAMVVSASRSALLGFAAAFLSVVPGLPRRVRVGLVVAVCAGGVAAVLARPGMVGFMVAMFTGASDDPSVLSRTGALERAPGFIAVSPLVGAGFGTFLPRYYIFDNQWVLSAVDTGLLGVAALAGLVAAAAWSAIRARMLSGQEDIRTVGQGLFAACVTAAVMMAGFDGLSFPISAGMLFLVLGACGALRGIADADRWMLDVRASVVDGDPRRRPRGMRPVKAQSVGESADKPGGKSSRKR